MPIHKSEEETGPILTPENVEVRIQLSRLRSEVGLLREGQSKIEGTLKEVRDKVLTTPLCPNPGLCVLLQQQGNDREQRLRVLERRDAIIVGVCIVLGFAEPLIMKYLFKI